LDLAFYAHDLNVRERQQARSPVAKTRSFILTELPHEGTGPHQPLRVTTTPAANSNVNAPSHNPGVVATPWHHRPTCAPPYRPLPRCDRFLVHSLDNARGSHGP
jgi:hypothetical protein